MARRTIWLATGIVAGAASSLYAERKLRRTVEAAAARLQPDALVGEVTRTARQAARSTGGRVRDAVATGRSEMHRREEEIWAGIATSDDVTPMESRPLTAPSSTPDVVPTVTVGPLASGSSATSDDAAPHGGRGRRRGRKSPSHLGK